MLGPFNAPTARETFVICHLRWLAPPLQRPHLLPSWSRLQNQLCHMAAGSGQPIRSVAPRAYKADLHKTSAGYSLGGYWYAVGYCKVSHTWCMPWDRHPSDTNTVIIIRCLCAGAAPLCLQSRGACPIVPFERKSAGPSLLPPPAMVVCWTKAYRYPASPGHCPMFKKQQH